MLTIGLLTNIFLVEIVLKIKIVFTIYQKLYQTILPQKYVWKRDNTDATDLNRFHKDILKNSDASA